MTTRWLRAVRRGPVALVFGLAVGAASAGLVGCDDPGPPPRPRDASPAAALGVHSRQLPERAEDQARLALAQDARRREHRFLDAVTPGHLFASTRVSQSALTSNRFDAEQIFQLGAQLFNVTFTRQVGFGAQDLPSHARFHRGQRGGPDATSCAQCHWRGGPAGGGDGADAAYLDGDGESQSTALARNPIALAGDGYVEILAGELSAELAASRSALVAAAKAARTPMRRELTAKGIAFGQLAASADGSLDTRLVEGVDADLIVRPFGHKGTFATLREAVEDALNVHHGMQSTHLAARGAAARVGSAPRPDPDGDGHTEEILEGQVSALTLFVAMQEVPKTVLPTRVDRFGLTASDLALRWAEGRTRFAEIGCASCHTPRLPLGSTVFSLPARDPDERGLRIDLATQGAEPRLARGLDGRYEAELYSDLKRHDMGAALAEPRDDRGVKRSVVLTRPLWGVARSRPYLPDGRAPTLEEAILLHGGEGQGARDAFLRLPEHSRGSLRIFLTSLTRAARVVVP